MTIICTCGCKVDDIDDIVTCSRKGWSREFTPCVDYVSYCPNCYKQALTDDQILLTEEDEIVWMRHEDHNID